MEAASPPLDVHGLTPYVPRLTLEWLRDEPEWIWRELDGTLAFVDISGFTAMSERLARLGRIGGEELTEVMNAVFAGLLEDAYGYGGGLLKFGGDALLLLYDGEDHAARAVTAAWEMRRTLRRLGRVRTSGGAVTLRMHVGVHSGPLHFFLVGDSHRELLLTGPGATRAVELETAAGAGEIVVGPETAALLDDRVLGEARDGGVLVVASPGVERRVEPLPAVDGLDLGVVVPRAVRTELTQGTLEGEHRHAAVGFIRFAGVDEALSEFGVPAVADRLNTLVRVIQAAADRYGVTFLESDLDRDGGKIVLVAGAPLATGADEERLLRTLRAVVDAAPPLPLHVGVSRGRVFAGQVGAAFRRTYTILGDTAATAARLMGKADEGEVLVADDVLERVEARFATTALPPFPVKGRTEPLRASLLGPLVESAPAAVPPARKLPFVDRERERAVLGASVAPVRSGFGTLVELVGEPGIGKSRLAEELRDACADMSTLSLVCDQYAATTPYHPFRAPLRSLLAVEPRDDPNANRELLAARLAELDAQLAPWAPLLAIPLDVEVASTPEVDELDPAFRRARLHGVVSAALERLLDGPTLVLVEDAHWMDEPSAELLRHVGTRLASQPWLVCTTRRGVPGGFVAAEGTPPLPALTLRLEPLPEADARELVRAAAGDRALRADEVDAILGRGSGNPLFLHELAASGDPGGDDELPENVESLVATRIDQLAPADRSLLRWASVLGVAFSGAVVAATLADEATTATDAHAWDRLAEFVERDPDVPGGLRFRHALIRDAAYEGLSFRRRRELHARVAQVLEQRAGAAADEAAEVLSLHFFRAGSVEKAWRYSLAAGRRAQAKWAPAEAAEFYRRALDAAAALRDVAPEEVSVAWEALADCLQPAGELDAAAKALASARRLRPADAPEQVALMRKEGALREAMGRYSDALRWYGRALKAAARLADPELRGRRTRRLELDRAQVRFRQGSFGECIRACREVVDAALAAADVEVLAPAYMTLHTVYTYLGAPERAAYRGLALPLYEELGDLKGQALALNNLGIEAYYEGDWEKALDVYERSRALFERVGDVTSVAMAMNNIGEILSDQGRLEEAAPLFEQVQRTCEEAGQRLFAAVALANRGRVATRAGELAEAEAQLRRALDLFTEMHAGSFVSETETRLAEVAVLGGRTDEALDLVAAVLERAGDAADTAAVQAAALRLRGAARLQAGDAAAAREDVERSLTIARAADARYEVALGLDLLVGLGASAADDAERTRLLEQLGVVRVARPGSG